mmetsp:Transcript_4552/g.10203  ORF Transcript_4552/g.10203 Transcript_4552/m.10203 type:complete len:253 (-) Transcript_4552:85-843(-)
MIHQALFQKGCSAMRDNAVTLHLPKAQTTIPRTSFHRLARQNLVRSTSTRVNLIVHHVAQPLVIRWPEEDLSLHHPSRVAVIHRLVPSTLVPKLVQLRGDVLHRHLRERRGVTLLAVKACDFAHQALDKVANRHARRNGVRVHDDVWRNALEAEWHVLLRIHHPDRSFLAVSRCKLVANLRNADRPCANLAKSHTRVVRCQQHLIHHASILCTVAHIALRELPARGTHQVLRDWRRLANHDVVAADAASRRC